LRAVEHDAQALAALALSVQASEGQHQVVQRQYRAGIASHLQVVVAEQQLLQARTGLIAAQAQRLADSVALAAAMAGEPASPSMPEGPTAALLSQRERP
jgi:outer membrane protein TolC